MLTVIRDSRTLDLVTFAHSEKCPLILPFMAVSPDRVKHRRFTHRERAVIFRSWREGRTFAELAASYGTHRQTTRAIVHSFNPRREDFRLHDYAWRERMLDRTERRRGKPCGACRRSSGPTRALSGRS